MKTLLPRAALISALSWIGLLPGGALMAAGPPAKSRHLVAGVPYVQQSHPNTCGAAALAMLLQYHGRKATEEEIIRAYPQMRRTGFYIPWLWEYSGKLGLKTASGAATAADLKGLLRRNTPVIVYQRSAPGRKRPHFRVIVGYDDGRQVFVVWDPAPQLGKGHEVPYATFERLWDVPYFRGRTHFYFTIEGRAPSSAATKSDRALYRH